LERSKADAKDYSKQEQGSIEWKDKTR
jgi:hypothetical protein